MTSFIQWNCSSRNGRVQALPLSTTSNTATTFGTETWQIRLMSDTACNYNVGDNVGAATVATTASAYLPPNFIEYVTCSPGQRLTAICAVSDGLNTKSSGLLWITEML
jgi:hypothetical protein